MNKLFLLIGVLIIIYILCLIPLNNFNIGILLGLIIGSIFIFLSILPHNKFSTLLKSILAVMLAFFIFMTSFIAVQSVSHEPDFSEDALIVLGCALHGDRLSYNLKDRLYTAIEYYHKNPSAKIVVSGGQGPQEKMPEAEAMYNYLVANGVPTNNIYKECNSTSTNENFKFSKQILDKELGSDYTITYITNDFHIYRAGKIAQLHGLEATGYPAPTYIHTIVLNYLRESLAVIQLWVFNK